MKRLFLVRHGSVENPKGIVYRRLPGFSLSQLGKKEAQAARDNLSHIPYEVVYHSPLERTLETAKIVNLLNAPLFSDDRINEWDEFESAADIVKRMNSFWNDWIASSIETAIAVSHRDSIRVLLLNLVSGTDTCMPLNNLLLFPLPQAGVYQLTYSPDDVRIEPYFFQNKLPAEFLSGLGDLETCYLKHDDPIKQSGFGGGEERWRTERGVVLEAVDSNGDFIDLGCANGYLLESLMGWARERGFRLTPSGVDYSGRLIRLAQERFPDFRENFRVDNCWYWQPARRYKYVYTLFDCVPEHLFGFYVHRLLHQAVEPGGRLIIGSYGSASGNQPARDMNFELRKRGLPITASRTIGELPIVSIAWIDA